MTKKRKYSTQSDLVTYHTIVMNGKKLKGVHKVNIDTGFREDRDIVTKVTLEFVIKAGSLKADGEVIQFDML